MNDENAQAKLDSGVRLDDVTRMHKSMVRQYHKMEEENNTARLRSQEPGTAKMLVSWKQEIEEFRDEAEECKPAKLLYIQGNIAARRHMIAEATEPYAIGDVAQQLQLIADYEYQYALFIDVDDLISEMEDRADAQKRGVKQINRVKEPAADVIPAPLAAGAEETM